jgi:hypothetical protein
MCIPRNRRGRGPGTQGRIHRDKEQPTSPAIPNGEVVTFYNGASKIGTGKTTNGAASLTTSLSTPGKHIMKASYPGDAWHKASSGTVKQGGEALKGDSAG